MTLEKEVPGDDVCKLCGSTFAKDADYKHCSNPDCDGWDEEI